MGPRASEASKFGTFSFRDSGVGGSHQTSTSNVQKTEGSCLQKEKPKSVWGPTATHRPQTIKRQWRQPARARPELHAKPRRWTATFPRSLPPPAMAQDGGPPGTAPPRHPAVPSSARPGLSWTRAASRPSTSLPHPQASDAALTARRSPPRATASARFPEAKAGWRPLTASRTGRPEWDSKEEEKGKEEKGGARKHWAAATATAAAPVPLSAEWAAQTAVAVYNYARCLMGIRQLLRLQPPAPASSRSPLLPPLRPPLGPPHIRASMILY